MHLCGHPEFGTYDGQVVLVAPDWLKPRWPNGIGIDVCLALEIQGLWRQGIKTNGHCCGHGRVPGFISVEPGSIEGMAFLGYQPIAHGEGHFKPKTPLSSVKHGPPPPPPPNRYATLG